MYKRAGKLCVVGAVVMAPAWMLMAQEEVDAPSPISDVQCLRKMSLDLRLRGPSAEQVDELVSGQATLADFADRFMNTNGFSNRMYNIYRGRFSPTDDSAADADLSEPARIARHIVVEDRDYREIVTADYTVDADGNVSQISGKPSAGVISTQAYMSAYAGAFKRNWAGHALKEWGGFHLEAVTLPPSMEDADLSPGSLADIPECAGCHTDEVYGIDHLARFALCFGDDGVYDSACVETEGSFLTVSGTGLTDLGALIADSNEFKSTTINFFANELLGRPLALEETDYYLRAVDAFVGSGYRAKALIRFIVTSPEYCAR